MKISLVVPAYNEEKGLPLVVQEYRDFVDEIIIVDDGSSDGTFRAAKLGYKIVEIPIEYRERVGKSKLNPIKDGARMLTALFSVAYTETSLLSKMILLPSMIFILIGLITGFISIYEKVQFGVISHEFYPIITAFLILVGVQLISLGLIVDYLTKKLDRIEERLVR